MPAIPKRVILYTNMLYWKFYEEKLARLAMVTHYSRFLRSYTSATREGIDEIII